MLYIIFHDKSLIYLITIFT